LKPLVKPIKMVKPGPR